MFTPINPIFVPALDLPAPERIHAEGGRAAYECGRAHIKIGRNLGGGIRRMLRALNLRRWAIVGLVVGAAMAPSPSQADRTLTCGDWSAWRQGKPDADMDAFGPLMVGNLQGAEAVFQFLPSVTASMFSYQPSAKRSARQITAAVDEACAVEPSRNLIDMLNVMLLDVVKWQGSVLMAGFLAELERDTGVSPRR